MAIIQRYSIQHTIPVYGRLENCQVIKLTKIDRLFHLFISLRVGLCNIMANYVALIVALLFIVTFALAQITNENAKDRRTFKKKLPVRLGSDGRPLLFAPKIEMCQTRKKI